MIRASEIYSPGTISFTRLDPGPPLAYENHERKTRRVARIPRGKYNGRFKFACIPPSLAGTCQRKSCDSHHVSAVRNCPSSESSRRGCKVLMTRADHLSDGNGMERDARGISERGSNDEAPHNFFVDMAVHRNRIFETREVWPTCSTVLRHAVRCVISV